MADNLRNLGYANGRMLRDFEIKACKPRIPPQYFFRPPRIQPYHSVHCLPLQLDGLRLKGIDCKNSEEVAYATVDSDIVEIWSANYPGRESKTETIKFGPGNRNTLSKSSDLLKVKELQHPAMVTAVSFMEGRILFTADLNGSVRMYDSIYELIDTWTEQMTNITDIHYNLRFDEFAVTSDIAQTSSELKTPTIHYGANIFSFYRKGPIRQFLNHEKHTEAIRFDTTGMMLAIAESHGQINIYDTRVDKPIRNIVSGTSLEKKRLEFSPGGRFIAAKHMGVVNIFEVATGRKFSELPVSLSANDEFDFSYNIPGNCIAVGGPAGLLRIWNVALGCPRASEDFCVGGPTHRIRCTSDSNFTCAL